ncbi:MAG TPA: alpha/beta hydrolase-fold protein [Solirubrobacteraceae bacterium]|nr:alpha/beta hydrolase-fold protein [Solirubrobacteraceae bacterium]
MRIGLALIAVGAVAAGAVALARSPGREDGEAGVTTRRYELRSRFVDRTLPQVAAVPPGGGEGRPLLVFLHGRGDDGEESNANDAFLRALAAQGKRAPVVVFPNGGEASYWHRRRGGDWARYMLDEVIPDAVRRFGADRDRIAIGGISMGGYGAYEIARLRPRRFCAVGGHSAATWLAAGDSAPGAFDDAADFERHDVVGLAQERGRRPWRRAALWLDGGDRDPFLTSDRAFAGALGIRMRVSPGGHDGDYWHRHYRDYLRFYARALERC